MGLTNREHRLLKILEKRNQEIEKLALDLWEHPETGLKEHYAAERYADLFQKAGFQIQQGVGPLETAVIATWGSSSPTLGFLGEYDALPGLSQKATARQNPVEKGAPGHGCGHNLLGAAAAGAALALAAFMEENQLGGTVIFYGCPAEENNGGKVFMAREGCFRELDAALSWHPWHANTVWNAGSLALNACNFNFHGRTAHAAASPEAGRSALDAAILMDVGVNYLREHMPQEARIHSVITSGGTTPNVVPGEATICYYVRAPRRDQVNSLFERVVKCARGAALMTETEVDVDMIDGLYDFLPNPIIGEVAMDVIKRLGGPAFTEESYRFAKELQETLPKNTVREALRYYQTTSEEFGEVLCERPISTPGPFSAGRILPGSTDVGDVSHLVPTVQITTCCMPLGVAAHTWQSTAAYGSSIGLTGMKFAAQTLALTGERLLEDPKLLENAKEAFLRSTGGDPYESPLLPGAEPKIR